MFIFFLFGILLFSGQVFAQGKPYEGPDDSAGDIAAVREGKMNGNRVYISFRNTTELSYCCGIQYSRWPNDDTGLAMTDGIGLLIAARVYLDPDNVPVTDPMVIKSRPDLHTLYYLQTSYRERMDKNPGGTLDWGFYPVFGYFNENSEYPALSNRPDSWPPVGWPARGDGLKWPGEWNGRFGRGVQYADLESYFVANDAQDQEYLGDDDGVRYYPRPGVKIGDKRPDVTVQYGMPWGGIGIRVSQRGYQWNNPQTRDAIFWEYDISNISDYDLTEMAFGYWVDNGIGANDPTDDIAFFDNKLDMCYSWDIDGIGAGGLRTGIMGLAYLESPGIAYDGKDNDDDGILDEKRDNIAKAIVGPLDGIADPKKFLETYGGELRPHWDADEDQDWQDGHDANGNGVYDPGEDYGDDVGLDGVGPSDLNYTGPDEGECNHKPDFVEGVGCEPNFAALDVSESDMLGLTSFTLFPIDHGSTTWFEFDGPMFHIMAKQALEQYIGQISNLVEIFASGLFSLNRGRTERISMSELHSYEELSGLNSSAHSAPALFQKKRIVQYIYENDYRFAQPPLMPTLTATAGDGKVILTWNDVADRLTREPLLKRENDFEGYKLYKATDKYFSDAEKLKDMYGNPIGKKPIYQCDLKNGKKGAADFVHINGEFFYLGDDTGISHYFVDTNVENGRTYYYGLAAYDYGLDGLEVAIMPSENNVVIDLNEYEEIVHVGRNVQVVTPHPPAAGYVEPSIQMQPVGNLFGDGQVIPEVADLQAIKPNHTYKVKFLVDTLGHARRNPGMRHRFDLVRVNTGLSVYDVTAGDSLVYQETLARYPLDNIIAAGKVRVSDGQVLYNDVQHLNNEKEFRTDIFNGIQLRLSLKALAGELAPAKSGWVIGKAPIQVTASAYESFGFPYQYDIVFTGDPAAYKSRVTSGSYIYDLQGGNGTQADPFRYFLGRSFPFYVINRSFPDSAGNYEKLDLLAQDVNHDGQFNLLEDRVLVGHMVEKQTVLGRYGYWSGTIFGFDFRNAASEDELPRPGDVYRVDFYRPFSDRDSLLFTVQPQIAVQRAALTETMAEIKVVPNPYVATNAMETALSNPFLNQRRRLIFTHIPADCDIKIFTSSGIFVDGIAVANAPDNGLVHWDMLTREGLEIAAGVYIFQVKARVSGEEKVGKFAVIK